MNNKQWNIALVTVITVWLGVCFYIVSLCNFNIYSKLVYFL